MQRYFIDQAYQSIVEISGEPHHHMSRVMRMSVDDQVFLVFNDQTAIKAKIVAIDSDHVRLEEVEKEKMQRELPIQITVASGFPKGEKLELIVQKGTELGAHDFVAFPGESSVAKWDAKKQKKKQQRLTKIAQEAAEQSHRQALPTVRFASEKELIASFSEYDAVLIAYEESAKQGEQAQLVQTFQQMTAGEKLLVVFGPEGGLTPKEIEKFQVAGAKLCGLGPRILRTETAPFYLLSAASFYFELQH
ncbi:16S rRNA (uracil(1498)-N(3))-methyltransferase [Enterococcus raffinosus]|uniref:Ribosomal RNA small subunit methyltransferase E n=1 Tax=Enterococcus raffinosus TaxID=71452 RepID=A0AAW8T6W1_9ENTE|nr:16S rRNA (uracil(1498)-N(3))-methyltransferase [Enterococcus raffinosus]MDT2521936.1 16S rRNA (uracil(1498)-N(3))-methyltransferase [Enterococcus raffinosus]MDT2528281.1 16S rRNA (uracil(1498)-N(3))-methyltransferase [Enterococcus raffinosus]MDT2533254.1 16S rRNA (uracil(1498)-N(3))-methyltransferase [Enterococcus raffinosus]MDT2543695.1 16S rRNA (uracil(1498)-N(3))-methyltransferase [Enterococcus raffinosus]MDT2553808.1 16S rRNA (uracil(1498)-N(3))-methyltransferase [Enterococcus raffinosu